MCEPTTIMLGMSLASGALGFKSALDQGKYQQRVAENNAITSEYAAKDALTRGAADEQQQRIKTRQVMGAQRAALAASGVDVNSGTGSRILTDSAGLGELDALTIRENAMRSAWGYQTQAENSRAEGALARYAGKQKAAASLLTAGGKAYKIGADAGWWGK